MVSWGSTSLICEQWKKGGGKIIVLGEGKGGGIVRNTDTHKKEHIG